MRVHRRGGPAQRGAQRQHSVRGIDQVLAPDHMGDLHLQVVDRIGQEEDRIAVGADDHEVGNGRPLDSHLAADLVHEAAHSLVRSAEPQGPRSALGGSPGPILGIELATVPVVARRPSGGPRRFGASGQLRLGAGAHVCPPVDQELLGGRAVLGEPRALQHRAFVPVESQPSQHVLDPQHPFVTGACLIGVLDAQDEGSPVVTSEEPVEQRGARRADVQGTRRSRREPDPNVTHQRLVRRPRRR